MTPPCSEHSGICTTTTFLNKELEELKTNFNIHKGEMNARLNGSDQELKQLRKELTDLIEKRFTDLEKKIDEKEISKDNKKWILIGSLGSPILILLLQQILEHLIK
jgi:DNA anti-recombination protein RmuC